MTKKNAHILIIEDNIGDIRLIQEVLKENFSPENLHIVTNGEDALLFLTKQNQYKNAETPNLIILDLNLPKKDGREVLSEIKTSENLKHIPVIVFTSSEAEKDIQKSYDLHANCYIVKPFDFNQYSKIIHNIQHFWLHVAKLPVWPGFKFRFSS